MSLKQTYLITISLIISSFLIAQNNDAKKQIKILTTQTDYEAGTEIILKFSTTKILEPLLYCSNSYGATLISPKFEKDILKYEIPKSICKKRGTVYWNMLGTKQLISGRIQIHPKQEVATMETYIGPPSIEAGGTDYSMLVVIPTDALDNPLAKNTMVSVKYQFLASEENNTIFTKNLISHSNIYSKKERGRMLVSSESLGINSKEFTINITAAIPTDFTISAKRPHDYADGNQVTTFSTSIIKDKQDNVVSNGTFVTFIIINKKHNILKTTGTTIEGIASAKMIHPSFEDQWRIKAYIDGMSESDIISLKYKQVIEDFKILFSKKNREVVIGPLQSFMQQMIPDGLQVQLHIYKNGKLLDTLIKTSNNGFVKFYLNPAIFENGDYNFSIQTAGKIKEFKNKKLW